MFKLDPYITSVLLRDLVGHDRRPASFLVYIWFTAELQNQAQQNQALQNPAQQDQTRQSKAQQRRPAVTISYQDLAESIGISKSSA